VGLEQQRDVAVVLRVVADLLQHRGQAEGVVAGAGGEYDGDAVGFESASLSSERETISAPLPIRFCTLSLRDVLAMAWSEVEQLALLQYLQVVLADNVATSCASTPASSASLCNSL